MAQTERDIRIAIIEESSMSLERAGILRRTGEFRNGYPVRELVPEDEMTAEAKAYRAQLERMHGRATNYTVN